MGSSDTVDTDLERRIAVELTRREKIAASKRGKPLSEEHRKKISAARMGQHISKEHVAKLVASHAGGWTEEHKRNHAAAFRTPEARAARSALSLRSNSLLAVQRKRAESMAKVDVASALHIEVRGAMRASGVVTATHVPVGPFIVDEANESLKLAVEVNGCYFHCCPVCHPSKGKPREVRALSHGVRRREYLTSHGWKLVEVWEHEWASDPAACIRRVLAAAAS